MGSPHLPPKTKLPAFCRAGRVGRKRWSPQHVPPSRPEPKATVHSCTVRAFTQDAVSFGYEVLVFARLCPLAPVVLFPVLFLLHGGKNSSPQRQRGGGLTAPLPSTPEPASIQNKVKVRPGNPQNSAASNAWEVLDRSE